MPCSCGFTTNLDNTCNGNHKTVKLVKDKIILNISKLEDKFTLNDNLFLLEEVLKVIKETK
jgi:hypothetical protein